MTAPAEQLRAAAAKLRDTAAKATPGPWATREVPDEVYVEIMAGTEVAVAHAVCEHPAAPGAAADAEWIVLMSPAVAEPLAALLEEVADGWMVGSVQVLDLALAILGEAP